MIEKEGWVEEEIRILIGPNPVLSIIRFKERDADFTFACVCDYYWHDNSVVLRGAEHAPRIREARALKRHFQAKGIKTVEWERRGGIGPRWVTLKIG